MHEVQVFHPPQATSSLPSSMTEREWYSLPWIDPRLRSVRVKIRPHSVCKWAVLTATSVTKVPSKDCYKKVGEDKEKNLTYTETMQMSCVVLGSWDTRVDMADGTVMVPSNGWERRLARKHSRTVQSHSRLIGEMSTLAVMGPLKRVQGAAQERGPRP